LPNFSSSEVNFPEGGGPVAFGITLKKRLRKKKVIVKKGSLNSQLKREETTSPVARGFWVFGGGFWGVCFGGFFFGGFFVGHREGGRNVKWGTSGGGTDAQERRSVLNAVSNRQVIKTFIAKTKKKKPKGKIPEGKRSLPPERR